MELVNGHTLLQMSREPSLDLNPAATDPDLTPLVALLSWRLAGFVDEDKYNMYETRKHSRTYGIVCLKDISRLYYYVVCTLTSKNGENKQG